MTTAVTIKTTIWPLKATIATQDNGDAHSWPEREKTIEPHSDVTLYVSAGQRVMLEELPLPEPD